MSAKIVDAQVSLTIHDSQTKPGIDIDKPNQTIHFHLTQGYGGGGSVSGPALTADAQVPVQGPMSGSTFGMVQIVRINQDAASYAGRISSEGGVLVTPSVPPALASPIMLDAGSLTFGQGEDPVNPPVPFFQDTAFQTTVTPGLTKTHWFDHPHSTVAWTINNSFASNVDNFLFNYYEDFDFWTIYTILDPTGGMRFLRYFQWKVVRNYQFKWVNKVPQVVADHSEYRMVVRNGKGRPPDGDIQPMLNNPVEPRANDAYKGAIMKAFHGARGPNRSELVTRFAEVPPDFWS